MNKVTIAFDIDGTLRCNCTETCRDTNEDVVTVARIFSKWKNTRLIAWSGGGAQYAQAFIDSDDRLVGIFGNRCYSKFAIPGKVGDPTLKPEIAIDDIQDCGLGLINLIVREK